MRSLIWCILSVCVLAGCEGDLEPASRIDGLRLLAVRADHASAEPGQEVVLDALFHDTKGRTLSWGYAFCDTQQSSAAVDCLKAIDLDSLVVEQDMPQFTFTMPEPAAGAQRDSAVGVAIIVCPGEIVPGDTDGLPIECRVEGEALPLDLFEIGVKRVYYTAEAENQNPRIAGLRWDGEPWPEGEIKQVTSCNTNSDDVEDCKSALRHKLEVQSDEPAERFVDSQGTETREQAVVQFYATGGSFEWSSRLPESAHARWFARHRDAGKLLTLFVVLRDSRGGVTWQTRQVQVRAN